MKPSDAEPIKIVKKQPDFGTPGAFAVARDQAGGDICAAALLYRIKHFFNPENSIKKLERFDREWIAMSRDEWARSAGLTLAEMKNRALPHIKKLSFVAARAMRLTPKGPKKMWISLDLVGMHAATTPSDMIEHFPAGEKWLGSHQLPAYPYSAKEA
jgi:hypothetical protein